MVSMRFTIHFYARVVVMAYWIHASRYLSPLPGEYYSPMAHLG